MKLSLEEVIRLAEIFDKYGIEVDIEFFTEEASMINKYICKQMFCDKVEDQNIMFIINSCSMSERMFIESCLGEEY
jgi:hypothetical protein